MIVVVRPGLFTTVQDLGRAGFGAFGVPPSGAMDAFSLRAANRLAGNDEGAAAFEITLLGPTLKFEDDAVVALCGSRFEVERGGAAASFWEAFRVARGETLTLGRSLEGARAYLAIRGGLDVPLVLGSRSTLASAGWGGFEGRALRAGDRLSAGAADPSAPLRRLRPDAWPAYTSRPILRAVAGPDEALFTPEALSLFFEAEFAILPQSDRAGIRMSGRPIARQSPGEVLPEGAAPGSVQVPPDGQPILLGADRPATGGYPKIATVISADLSLAGQAKPGDRIRFSRASAGEGRGAWQGRETMFRNAIEDLP
jgi:antagonist of KipI